MSLVKFYTKPFHNTTLDHFFNHGISKVVGSDSVKTNPLVNINESNNGFTIELAAPGLHKEDLKVDVNKNILTIKAEKTEPQEGDKESGKYTRKEFSYASFKRSFTLPENVDQTKVEAHYENGILLVNVPKKEETKPQPAREITIS